MALDVPQTLHARFSCQLCKRTDGTGEERAKNGNGHFISTDGNGSCTGIERGLNGNGTGMAVPLHGRDIGTFY